VRYDLSRFSPGSFQSFAQSLALHEFGPGLQVYGLGPDGGRDASFNGSPNYPSKANPWTGYTVIQVKYKEKPSNDSRDADWLVTQVKKEQTRWKKAKGERHPDYYLLITNVDLSPLPRTLRRNKIVRKGGLAKVRLTEPARCKRVINRLIAASKSPATTQLMISPLQVAILFTLVDLKGDVPTDRWTLFNRYFTVLGDREEEKLGKHGELLRKYRVPVEIIHQRAGFLLHVEAERSGGAESFLTEKQFEQLASQFLASEGYTEEELASVTKDLATLVTQRLVLLAPRVEGRIAFDVRSLQEFMAAAMITSDKDGLVAARLRAIAGKAHWRHVFQIAASRCFADTGKRHLAEIITTLCNELDAGSEDEADRLAKSGARLAIDLLADGLALDAPKQRRLLFDRALQCLDLGPRLADKRLATIVDRSLASHCAEAIRARTSP
jgi:hypothetical protein